MSGYHSWVRAYQRASEEFSSCWSKAKKAPNRRDFQEVVGGHPSESLLWSMRRSENGRFRTLFEYLTVEDKKELLLNYHEENA